MNIHTDIFISRSLLKKKLTRHENQYQVHFITNWTHFPLSYHAYSLKFMILFCQVKEQDDKDNIGDDVIGRNLRAKHIMNVVECEDANENTPISEAGSMRYCFVSFLRHKDSNLATFKFSAV